MAGFTHITKPTQIPVPGGKLIEELIGLVNTKTGDVSVAHMKSPPGWGPAGVSRRRPRSSPKSPSW